jgi:thiol:disulfide interchange protein DsbD
VFAGLTLYFLVSRPPSVPAGWGDDLTAGIQQARVAGKNLVIDFYSEGCPPCMAMDRFVLPSAEVQAAVADFVSVRVNVVRDSETAARFKVSGTPTFVIASPDGTALSRIEGYITPEMFVSFLKQTPSSPSADAPPTGH